MPHVRIFLPEVLQLAIHVHNTQHTFLSWFVGHCLLHVSFLSGTLPEVHQQQKFGFLRKNVSSLKHPSAFSNATCSLVLRPSPSFSLLAALKILPSTASNRKLGEGLGTSTASNGKLGEGLGTRLCYTYIYMCSLIFCTLHSQITSSTNSIQRTR